MYINSILIRSTFFSPVSGECMFCFEKESSCKCVSLISDDIPNDGDAYVGFIKKEDGESNILNFFYKKGDEKNFVRINKIIAMPDEIGYISFVLGKNKEPIASEIIQRILNRGGSCKIEVVLDKDNNKFVPKLENNKVTICI